MPDQRFQSDVSGSDCVTADSQDSCRTESFRDSACPVKTACRLLSDCSFGVLCSELLHAFHCMAVMSVTASDAYADLIWAVTVSNLCFRLGVLSFAASLLSSFEAVFKDFLIICFF